MNSNDFRRSILKWYDQVKRPLRWRDTSNPYIIWISEVMLQQTRVDQVTPFFERFIQAFPTVESLASADLQDVLMQWEGLGYYSRARNLHYSAKIIVDSYHGNVPSEWDEIRALKGIGDYTAAAVLSIAFKKPFGVVDGNVIRVIARFLGITDDVSKMHVKKIIRKTMDELIDQDSPGEFNQGVMELGSLICTPVNPNCEICPISTNCLAYNLIQTETIPYKPKKKKVPHFDIAVGIILDSNNKILISKRPENAMLGGLWEFPGGKMESDESLVECLERELSEELGIAIHNISEFAAIKHAYSHFKVTIHAFTCMIKSGTPQNISSSELKWISINELPKYPFPKANRKISDKLLSVFGQ